MNYGIIWHAPKYLSFIRLLFLSFKLIKIYIFICELLWILARFLVILLGWNCTELMRALFPKNIYIIEINLRYLLRLFDYLQSSFMFIFTKLHIYEKGNDTVAFVGWWRITDWLIQSRDTFLKKKKVVVF